MHFRAAAATTPSGVPPTPNSTSMPVSHWAVAMAPYTSPSEISRTRAPASRTWPISSSWRGAVEDDGGQVSHALALGLGDGLEVLGRRGGDVDDAHGGRADGDLLHVDAGAGVEHRALLAHGDHRQGVAASERGERGAVDGSTAMSTSGGAVADALAVVEHRGLVLLALADDDDAVHRDGLEDEAHGLDGRAVGAVLVAAAHPAGRGEGGGLGDPHQLQGQVAVGR
jgi:hypothetical protein